MKYSDKYANFTAYAKKLAAYIKSQAHEAWKNGYPHIARDLWDAYEAILFESGLTRNRVRFSKSVR